MKEYKTHPKYIRFYKDLEENRKKYRNRTIFFFVLSFICFLVALTHLIIQENFISNYYFTNVSPWIIKIIGTFSLGFLTIGIFVLEDYKLHASNALHNVVNEIYFTDDNVSLDKDDYLRDIYESAFYESNIFPKQDILLTKKYEVLSENKAVTFSYILSDIYFGCSGSSDKHPNQVISQGMFGVINLNKKDIDQIYIIQKGKTKLSTPRKSMILNKKILTGDKKFDKRFRVYSNSLNNLGTLLTPELREMLLNFSKATKAKTYLSFNKDKLYIAIECPKKIRLPLFTSINKEIMDQVVSMIYLPQEVLKYV